MFYTFSLVNRNNFLNTVGTYQCLVSVILINKRVLNNIIDVYNLPLVFYPIAIIGHY